MNNEGLAAIVTKALKNAWYLGQLYCQQADSEYWSENRRSDKTKEEFYKLEEYVRNIILSNT